MRRSGAALLVLMSAGLPGCRGFSGAENGEMSGGLEAQPPLLRRDSAAPIQTDSLSYTLRSFDNGYAAAIAFVFSNPITHPVYVATYCRGGVGVHLQKQSDGDWVDAWSPIVPRCGSPPIVLAARQQYRDTAYVIAGYPWNNFHPRFKVPEIPGVYRLVSNVATSYDSREFRFSDPLPLEQRVSNPFWISTAPR